MRLSPGVKILTMFAVAIQTVEILAHPPKEIPHALIIYYKWTEQKPEYFINLFEKAPL
jgi:hypothetical protein